MTDIAPASVARALDVLDQLGDEQTATEVRALRKRAASLAAEVDVSVTDVETARAALAERLADGTTNFAEAGDELAALEHNRRAAELGESLVGEVRDVLAARLLTAAAEVGDGWVAGMKPAVINLADALEAAAKLTDGALSDVAAGNGTPAQRAAVARAREALPPATAAQDAAWELRADGLVPADGMPFGNYGRYRLAGNWVDETPVLEEARASRVSTAPARRPQPDHLIYLRREYGAVPDLATAAEIAERESEGHRHAAREAERHQARLAATRQGPAP